MEALAYQRESWEPETLLHHESSFHLPVKEQYDPDTPPIEPPSRHQRFLYFLCRELACSKTTVEKEVILSEVLHTQKIIRTPGGKQGALTLVRH